MSRGWPGAWCATSWAAVPLLAVALSPLTGCGGDGSDPALPAQAEQGRAIVRTHGCSACHGGDAEGGVGPAFTGLYGSQVALADGSTVVADDAFLTESIRTPTATKVAGYAIDMPANDLDDDQIAAVVAYIRALAATEQST